MHMMYIHVHTLEIITMSYILEMASKHEEAKTLSAVPYLDPGQVWPEGYVSLLHMRGPRREQGVTELLVKVTSVGHEC